MSETTEPAPQGRTLQDELRAAAQESDDYSLLARAASALDEAASALDAIQHYAAPKTMLLGVEDALAFLGMGKPQVVEVHHHDIEKHAESFNEGYNTAMAHRLMSDDELQAGGDPEEWLKSRQVEAHAAGWQACVDARYQVVQESVKRGLGLCRHDLDDDKVTAALADPEGQALVQAIHDRKLNR